MALGGKVMKITSAIAAASIFVVACTAVPTNTFAIEYPNIMIVGEDDDKDTEEEE